MIDIYNFIISDPIYLAISVILAVTVVFSVVKKLFKFAVIMLAICMLYVGYLYYSEAEIPKTADALLEDVSNRAEEAVETLMEKSENLIKKADKLVKDKKP